jgi:LmbE family N-acetylglucosaminyl deacetylase
MATLVSFHAHPDDEAIATGGTLARAAEEGHRVVLVVATKGEYGEVADGFLEPGESLADRRTKETLRAAEILGVHRVEFLGYVDSGMVGTPTNDDPASFCKASLDEAAERLAAILRDESAEVLTTYDSDGGYGHPDHIAVHRVGWRAAELAGTPRVLESTMNRDHFKRLLAMAPDFGLDLELPDPADFDAFGRADADITVEVDVTDYLDRKRAAMAAHASQIAETSFFLALPQEAFVAVWGTEWYAAPGHTGDRQRSVWGR